MGDHRHGAHSHHGPAHLGGDGVAGSQRRLSVALVLAATYMVAEVIGGLITGSLALLADAGHMLVDVLPLQSRRRSSVTAQPAAPPCLRA